MSWLLTGKTPNLFRAVPPKAVAAEQLPARFDVDARRLLRWT
jgi:hypothetical protein